MKKERKVGRKKRTEYPGFKVKRLCHRSPRAEKRERRTKKVMKEMMLENFPDLEIDMAYRFKKLGELKIKIKNK